MPTRASLCLLILFALSCDNSSGPTTPPAPPKVLPQAPTSCTYRLNTPYFDDRVGRFTYDIRWFPPERPGSDPVTSYEVTVRRAAVMGSFDPVTSAYQVESRRDLPVVTRTVRARTGTTDDLHTIRDAVTFPVCELLARGEDLGFWAQVRARSAAGMSLPFTCVEADRLWDGFIWLLATDRGGYWYYHCNQTGAAAGTTAAEWVKGMHTH